MARSISLNTTDGGTLRILESQIYKVTDNTTSRGIIYAGDVSKLTAYVSDTLSSIKEAGEFLIELTDENSKSILLPSDKIEKFYNDEAGSGTKIITAGLYNGIQVVTDTVAEVEAKINAATEVITLSPLVVNIIGSGGTFIIPNSDTALYYSYFVDLQGFGTQASSTIRLNENLGQGRPIQVYFRDDHNSITWEDESSTTTSLPTTASSGQVLSIIKYQNFWVVQSSNV